VTSRWLDCLSCMVQSLLMSVFELMLRLGLMSEMWLVMSESGCESSLLVSSKSESADVKSVIDSVVAVTAVVIVANVTLLTF
jgi:hypothetical protein